MRAREEVLSRVRTALADRAARPGVRRDYRGADGTAASLDLFAARVEEYRARVHRAAPSQVAEVLGRLVARGAVVPAGFPDDWLTRIDVDLLRDSPALSPHDLDAVPAVLTTCTVAIAETGTVVLDAGPGQGRRALSLVPDHHVVVVRADQVVATVPEALTRLDPLRPQTWISGPSATSDIELIRVEGVHGPRSLDIVVVA